METVDTNNSDAKASFRKPSNDASGRNYRRRSPTASNSSDESPKRESKEGNVRRKREDDRELDRDSGRHSDRQSSRSYHGYRRHEDYRREKYGDDEGKDHHRLPSRSVKDSRDATHPSRHEGEHNRSNDHVQDKYSRDLYDRPGNRSKDRDRESLEDQKYKDKDSGRGSSGKRHNSSNLEERSGERDRLVRKDEHDEKKDLHMSMRDGKSARAAHNDIEYQKHSREEKRNYDSWDGAKKEHLHRDKSGFVSEDQNSPAKKSKFSSSEKQTEYGKDGDQRQSSGSKQAQETIVKVPSQKGDANNSETPADLAAAKFAAMKAAELVNRNLVGVGVAGSMSTDQKKKLLWGSKKNTSADETSNRWDSSLFPDREQQEKFNRLMGVKGEPKAEHKPDQQGGTSSLLQVEKQKELQLDLEKQYTAGLRRRDGRTVGLGL